MKKIVTFAGKMILAGILAIIILSGVMCFYDLMPLHYENKKGNTDYIWQPNGVWVKLTEGISFGKYDSAGYNNPKVIDNPDIIILGSSHMEGTNVFFDQTVCSQLAKKLDNNYSVYNLGISGQNLFTLCQDLPINLKMHNITPKVAIMETDNVIITEQRVQQLLNAEVKKAPSYSTGIIGTLQKVPFFRRLYHQYEGGLLNLFISQEKSERNNDNEQNGNKFIDAIDEKPYDALFQYLYNQEKEYGTQIIIFYHPKETFTKTGDIAFSSGDEIECFTKYAEKYEIDFVDMTKPFEQMYSNDHFVAHGFITGRVGEGHLNEHGHYIIAEELSKVIERMEREGAICK